MLRLSVIYFSLSLFARKACWAQVLIKIDCFYYSQFCFSNLAYWPVGPFPTVRQCHNLNFLKQFCEALSWSIGSLSLVWRQLVTGTRPLVYPCLQSGRIEPFVFTLLVCECTRVYSLAVWASSMRSCVGLWLNPGKHKAEQGTAGCLCSSDQVWFFHYNRYSFVIVIDNKKADKVSWRGQLCEFKWNELSRYLVSSSQVAICYFNRTGGQIFFCMYLVWHADTKLVY